MVQVVHVELAGSYITTYVLSGVRENKRGWSNLRVYCSRHTVLYQSVTNGDF